MTRTALVPAVVPSSDSLVQSCIAAAITIGLAGARQANENETNGRTLAQSFIALSDGAETLSVLDLRRKLIVDGYTETFRAGVDADLLVEFDSFSRDERRAMIAAGTLHADLVALHDALNTTGAQLTYAYNVAVACKLHAGFRAHEAQTIMDSGKVSIRAVQQIAKSIVDTYRAAVKAAGDASKVNVTDLFGEDAENVAGETAVNEPVKRSDADRMLDALNNAFKLATTDALKGQLLAAIAARVDVNAAATAWGLTVPAADAADAPAPRTRRPRNVAAVVAAA